MGEDVRQDADLLNTILNEAPLAVDRVTGRPVTISAKVLAHWTDRSIQTISDYRVGKTNIPVDFWRCILTHVVDARILQLILPDDVMADILTIGELDQATAIDFFRQALTAEGEHHNQQKYIAELLVDGRVDELDAASVQAYDDAYVKHRHTDATLHRAIIVKYQRAVAASNAAKAGRA